MENQSLALNSIPEDSAFSIQGFEHAQRISKMLADSTIVPEIYRGKVSNCIIALEMANRMSVSPLMVMQNMHIIKGKPGWSSTFIIGSLNTCGRFTELDFRQVGEKGADSYGYEAFANSKKTGKELVSPVVDWLMVKGEGWLSKDGSKWRTMPELMFRYRSAAFFGRLHAPDILMGMHAIEEIMDIAPTIINPLVTESITVEDLMLLAEDKMDKMNADDFTEAKRIIDNKEFKSYAKLKAKLQAL
jgi:hypothetical protein